MVRLPYGVLLLSSIWIALAPGGAAAQSPFDGRWSVLFNTDRGECERSYRAGVRIFDGYITADATGFNLDGRVSRNGSVRAVISAGSQAASGSGRLTRTHGGGMWRGRGNSGYCAGTWLAERRD
jgi:hypothetical protein